MHPKVLSKPAWKLVRSLVEAGLTKPWTLAGGTALALQMGHRYSEDLDFFRAESFSTERLLTPLAAIGEVHIHDRSTDMLHLALNGLRLSFLNAEAPLLFPGTPYRGITVADPRDIAVMKLIAIGGRGSRKDFVDLYFILRGGASLEDVFALVRRRFERIDYNTYHLLKSLVYFRDAEAEPMPEMLRKVSWEQVKKTLTHAVRGVGGGGINHK